MCLVGEMKRDYTWFEKAWEQSGHKCSKAMRMLGRYYFFENKFEKSIECYDKSLEINRL
jgi:tetratricopeptide (TPR) repeat protein